MIALVFNSQWLFHALTLQFKSFNVKITFFLSSSQLIIGIGVSLLSSVLSFTPALHPRYQVCEMSTDSWGQIVEIMLRLALNRRYTHRKHSKITCKNRSKAVWLLSWTPPGFWKTNRRLMKTKSSSESKEFVIADDGLSTSDKRDEANMIWSK